jgi:hypothetical protein
MLTENLLKPGVADLHILLSEFVEEIKKDYTVVISDDGKPSEKFEKYKSRILEIFSEYDWRYLISCINPEDRVWHAISYFYHDIVKFLIDKCEDKESMKILLHDAVTLQADLASRLPKTADFAAKDFCFDFSVSFVSCFAGK